MEPQTYLAALAASVVIFGGVAVMIMKFYRKVEQGKALIINKLKADPEVTFTGGTVLPILHKAEVMDISVKTIEIDRRGKEGLICGDNIRADIKVIFFVRVNKTREDVIKVAQAIGCERASDRQTLDDLFSAKFSEALKTVGKQLDFVDLYTQREQFRDQIIAIIGRDLNGYILEDAAIDFLEQTPVEHLDDKNILDAQGIRRITELTTIEHVRTNAFENEEQKQIKKQDVEAREAILELERQQSDAEAKQLREIESMRAREQAETQKVQHEERLKSENARIKADEEVAINDENRQREVEVAGKNRERVVGVENERVKKARDLEAVDREREVELRRIDKEKALEVEKREIANVMRERIAVEKGVAEQEEAIKTVRVVEDAERARQSTIITAEAEAQELLVKDIKAAEAGEKAAHFKAREQIALADAGLEAAEREAKAEIRRADGQKAAAAAPGLAEVLVKEANAIALEKEGFAEARVKEADAAAIAKMGEAEATALRERFLAEAKGIQEKATSMNTFDDGSRAHEEYRLRIENQRTLGLESIEAQERIAEAQARLIQEGLKAANIDIVGGESIFFDRLVNSISNGKAVDQFFDKSETASHAFKEYLNGDESLVEDVKSILTNPALSTQDVQNLSIAALLARLMGRSDDTGRAKLGQLLSEARRLGVDRVEVN